MIKRVIKYRHDPANRYVIVVGNVRGKDDMQLLTTRLVIAVKLRMKIRYVFVRLVVFCWLNVSSGSAPFKIPKRRSPCRKTIRNPRI